MARVEMAVFDSSAILAVLLNESGGAEVSALIQGSHLSTVNLLEVHTRLLLGGVPADLAWGRILGLKLDICNLNDQQARIAAELIWVTRPLGLSLGDRACLALAIQRQAMVYTTDKAWKNLDLGIEIEVIR